MLQFKLPKEAELKKENQQKYVIKITVGDKYYIGRVKNFEFIKEELKNTYKRYKFGNGIPETNQYYTLVRYMDKAAIELFEIEILFCSDNGYEILKEELNQLVIHFGKPDCLNANNIPNIPKFQTKNHTNKWLTRNEFLNFSKLLKKYNY